jgi:hypothetical protein
MKILYIILAHTNAEQTFRLFRTLDAPCSTFVFHISTNCEPRFFERLRAALTDFDNCLFAERTPVRWGRFDINRAIMNAIDTAIHGQIDFDYAILLSGQCYPIKSHDTIVQVLERHSGKQFLENEPLRDLDQIKEWVETYHFWVGRRHFRYPYQERAGVVGRLSKSLLALFLPQTRTVPHGYTAYKGSFLWMVTRDCLCYVHEQVRSPIGKDLIKFFKHANNSGELFFHTLLMNSVYKDDVINSDLRLSIWPAGGHAHVFTSEDYDTIEASDCLFVRKVDTRTDAAILDSIDRRILLRPEA